MLAIHFSVRVTPVRAALSHGDHGNCAYYGIKVLHYYWYYTRPAPIMVLKFFIIIGIILALI